MIVKYSGVNHLSFSVQNAARVNVCLKFFSTIR